MRISDWSSDVCSSDLAAARTPTALGKSGRGCRFRRTAFGSYPWRPVLALESVRADAAAVRGRPASPAKALDLHQPRHRLLGAAAALRCAVRDHPATTGSDRKSTRLNSSH